MKPLKFWLYLSLFSLAWSAVVQAAPKRKEHSHLAVTATAYNSLRAQTDRSPMHGAWGDRMDKLPKGVRGIAVSSDLYKRGLKRHTRVRIKGVKGEFMVVDRTAKRWRNRIDICMGKDIRAARRWGKRKVHLIVVGSHTSRMPPRTRARLSRRK